MAVAGAAVLWGTSGVAAKIVFAISPVTPLAIGFFRLGVCVPVLLLLGQVTPGGVGRLRLPHGAQRAVLAVLGAAVALYQVFYYAAVQRAGVAVATLVTLCLAPVLVAVLSAVLLRERPTAVVAGALVLALAGVGLLVGAPTDAVADVDALMTGVLLACGSALSYAVVTVAGRVAAAGLHPFQIIILGFSGGAVVLLACVLAQGWQWPGSPLAWLLLVYLGVVPTALAYTLFFHGMRQVTATVASIVSLLEPLTATVLAWLVFGERLGTWGLLGAVLLLGALLRLLYTGGTAAPALAR
jgi:DME family drug/metabolite transporter